MIKRYLLIIFSFFSLVVIGQADNCDCCIEGRILNSSKGTPVPYATILLKGTNDYALADEKGYFKLPNNCPKTFVLVISCLGFESITTEEIKFAANRLIEIKQMED